MSRLRGEGLVQERPQLGSEGRVGLGPLELHRRLPGVSGLAHATAGAIGLHENGTPRRTWVV